jgi:hypothetical protein
MSSHSPPLHLGGYNSRHPPQWSRKLPYMTLFNHLFIRTPRLVITVHVLRKIHASIWPARPSTPVSPSISTPYQLRYAPYSLYYWRGIVWVCALSGGVETGTHVTKSYRKRQAYWLLIISRLPQRRWTMASPLGWVYNQTILSANRHRRTILSLPAFILLAQETIAACYVLRLFISVHSHLRHTSVHYRGQQHSANRGINVS